MPYKYHTLDVPAKLHVIAVKFNPNRYQSQYRLHEDFQDRMLSDPNVVLWVGEAALAHRPHVVTDVTNPRHFRFYTKTELWSKEALINAVLRRIPREDSQTEQYIAWVDADTLHSRHDWAVETIHQLQHYDLVQTWKTMQDLGPRHEVIGAAISGGGQTVLGKALKLTSTAYDPKGEFFHPGFSWAARRSALDTIGGLIDWAVLGSADHHMMAGLFGKVLDTIPYNMPQGYKDKAVQWQTNALKLKQNFGAVDSHLLHFFHGSKQKRYYESRWDILVRNKFDPNTDLVYNSEGLPELSGDKPQLRDDIRRYFTSRDEDSTTV